MMHRPSRSTVIAVTVLFAAGLVSLAIFSGVYALSQVREQAAAISSVVHQTQVERARNIRDSCRRTNHRHDDTIRTLDRLLLSRLTGKPVDRGTSPSVVSRRLVGAVRGAGTLGKAAAQSRTSAVLLVQALAPRRDCVAVVRRRTGP